MRLQGRVLPVLPPKPGPTAPEGSHCLLVSAVRTAAGTREEPGSPAATSVQHRQYKYNLVPHGHTVGLLRQEAQ